MFSYNFHKSIVNAVSLIEILIILQSWVDYLPIVIRYWFQITWQKL